MVAMENAQYVLPGYAIVVGSGFAYAAWLVRRGRSLAKRVPPERRRWSDS
jgi:hypothetical protein